MIAINREWESGHRVVETKVILAANYANGRESKPHIKIKMGNLS